MQKRKPRNQTTQENVGHHIELVMKNMTKKIFLVVVVVVVAVAAVSVL